jgi:hypothetical protein
VLAATDLRKETPDNAIEPVSAAGPKLSFEGADPRWWRDPRLWLVALLSLLARIWFWASTGWMLEDALILARVARNLAEHGELAFNVGERASSATSPLFAALVGGLAALGPEPVAAAKLLGLLAGGVTVAVLYRTLRLFVAPGLATAGALLYGLLPPVVAYSVCGLETPVYTLACAGALHLLARGRCAAGLAVAWLSVAIRPDGILLVASSLGVLLLLDRAALRSALYGALPALAAVLGVGALHWWHYGVALPHSAIAKAVAYHPTLPANLLRYLDRMLLERPEGLGLYLLAAIGAFIALRSDHRLLGHLVWYVVYHAAFMLRAPLFSWYLQPPLFALCLLAVVGLAGVGRRVDERAGRRRPVPLFAAVVAWSLVAASLLSLVPYAQGRRERLAYERTVRAAAGRWLGRHAETGALVFTESLGFIGYESDHRFVDWPGIASPEVLELLETERPATRWAGYRAIVRRFEPGYLALRGDEWEEALGELRADYREVARFEPGRGAAGPAFVVARRVAGPPQGR